MHQKQNGFSGILIGVIAAIVLVAIAGIGFVMVKQQGNLPITQPQQQIASTTNQALPVVGATTVKTSTSAPTINIVSPNGGERWPLGSAQTIRWTSTGNIPQVSIMLVPVDQSIGTHILLPVAVSNTGSYSWTIPICTASNPCSSNFQIAIGSYYIQITGTGTTAGITGLSAAPFSIVTN